MSDLLCAGCRTPLAEVPLDHGMLRRCDSCGGQALNVALLRRIAPQERVRALWRLVAARPPGTRPCPSCGRTMPCITTSEPAAITLDGCPHCLLVWFDRKELEGFSPENQTPAPLPEPPADADQRKRVLRVGAGGQYVDGLRGGPERTAAALGGFDLVLLIRAIAAAAALFHLSARDRRHDAEPDPRDDDDR